VRIRRNAARFSHAAFAAAMTLWVDDAAR